jgi:hypothetical protein
MTLRRVALSLLSVALGILLMVALIRISKIDWRATLAQLRAVNGASFTVLAALNTISCLLSTLKWRSVDAVLLRSSDGIPRLLFRSPSRASNLYLREIDARHYYLGYWSDAEWSEHLQMAGLTLVHHREYLTQGQVQRWEWIACNTSGILYSLTGKKEHPVRED